MPTTLKVSRLPDCTVDGVTEVMVGTVVGVVTVNETGLDGPAEGEGLETVTWNVPGVVNAEGEIVACKEE